MVPVTVPVAGLTPYPADVRGQPDWAAQVVLTPVSLLTVGDTSTGSVADKYDAAHRALAVEPAGGAYGGGMVNSDPIIMLASGDPKQIGTAVHSLAVSAKVLNVLTVASALYTCREGDKARLSNELFHQVGAAGLDGRAARGSGGTDTKGCSAEHRLRFDTPAACCRSP